MQSTDLSRFERDLSKPRGHSRPHLNFGFNLTFLLRTSPNILIIFILEAVELTADVFPIFRFCPNNQSGKWSFLICLFRRKAVNARKINI